MNNAEKLKELVLDVLLIDDDQYHVDLNRADVSTWDSLGVVALAVGVHETFDHHMTPDEAVAVQSVRDIVSYLESKGLTFEES
ncbi:MAG: hypothetical protein CSB49_04375 [Proteobacteria bacterium]|nr:MAG: hypothetical protein CSB49_04375 [Pseudomonadota bacterium]